MRASRGPKAAASRTFSPQCAPSSPARAPKSSAEARPSACDLHALTRDDRHLLRRRVAELARLFNAAPAALRVDDALVRLADHKRKVVQIIEVDAVADGLIRRVQAAQLQRVLVRARDRRHRLIFAKSLDLAARARRSRRVALHHRHLFAVDFEIDVAAQRQYRIRHIFPPFSYNKYMECIAAFHI